MSLRRRITGAVAIGVAAVVLVLAAVVYLSVRSHLRSDQFALEKGRPTALHGVPDRPFQPSTIDLPLDEVILRAGRECRRAARLVDPACQDDDRHVGGPRA